MTAQKLAHKGAGDVERLRHLGLIGLPALHFGGELARSGVHHSLDDSEKLRERKRKVNGSSNFPLSGAIAASYSRLPGMDSPAERLRLNVDRLLTEQGKTQAELAAFVQKSRPWISQLLSGRRATTMAPVSRY